MKFITSLLCAVATIVVCLGDATIGDSDLKQDHPALAMAVDASIASGKSSSFMSKCPERLDTEHAEMWISRARKELDATPITERPNTATTTPIFTSKVASGERRSSTTTCADIPACHETAKTNQKAREVSTH